MSSEQKSRILHVLVGGLLVAAGFLLARVDQARPSFAQPLGPSRASESGIGVPTEGFVIFKAKPYPTESERFYVCTADGKATVVTHKNAELTPGR
jgi:hypothetical protein